MPVSLSTMVLSEMLIRKTSGPRRALAESKSGFFCEEAPDRMADIRGAAVGAFEGVANCAVVIGSGFDVWHAVSKCTVLWTLTTVVAYSLANL